MLISVNTYRWVNNYTVEKRAACYLYGQGFTDVELRNRPVAAVASLYLGEAGASQQSAAGQARSLPVAAADMLRHRDHLVIIDHMRVR